MKSTLLIVGGVAQILITILHIGIFFGIASSAELDANTKVTSYIFNAAVLTTVIFFAYVSLFRRQELINTTLGRFVCGFIAVFYIQRGLIDIFLRGEIKPLSHALLLLIASIYIITLLPPKQKESKD